MKQAAESRLSVRNIQKQFGGALALNDVSIDFVPGRTHILFGENGAGKSTLIKVLVGVHLADAGEILINDSPVHLRNPRDAKELGIAVVHQDPSLVDALTVAENICMGQEPATGGWLSPKKLHEFAEATLEKIGSEIAPTRLIKDLTRAEQQIVEMARSVSLDSKILILDEPTASLTNQETEQLFEIIEGLKKQNITIIYITHRMSEIREIGDDISVLRDGQLVATSKVEDHSDEELIAMMVGRKVEAMFPDRTRTFGGTVLEISDLKTAALSDVSLHVRQGEILGITGLVGSGKHHLGEACYGLREFQGRISLDDAGYTPKGPRDAISTGLVYYPSDRKRSGLINTLSALENAALSRLNDWSYGGLLSPNRLNSEVKPVLERLDLRPFRPKSSPNAFSGGNQQKIVLARGFVRDYKVHIFDEPTAGVDVGARAEIYAAIDELAREGAAVVIISSDLPEVVNLVDRAYVIAEGSVVGEFEGESLDESQLLPAFFISPHHQNSNDSHTGKV